MAQAMVGAPLKALLAAPPMVSLRDPLCPPAPQRQELPRGLAVLWSRFGSRLLSFGERKPRHILQARPREAVRARVVP